MIFKALVFVLFGAALVLGNPVYENFETTTKKESRDIIEVDETEKGSGIVVPEAGQDKDDENELPSGGFSTLPPTPEPTVGEEELPEDLTESPANRQPSFTRLPATPEPTVGEEEIPEDESVQDKVEKWIGDVEEKVKDHFEGKKEVIKDTLESIKDAWNRWHLF